MISTTASLNSATWYSNQFWSHALLKFSSATNISLLELGVQFTPQWLEVKYNTIFSHIIGQLMYVATISRLDLSYAFIHFFGYVACPNEPIFTSVHHCLWYVFQYPHLPIMYPNRPQPSNGSTLHTFCSCGQAESLLSDFGDELVTFTNANHARCLPTHCSVSIYFILHHTFIKSWGCKRQPVTSIHSTSREITALHLGATKTKTLLLHTFLGSIGYLLHNLPQYMKTVREQ